MAISVASVISDATGIYNSIPTARQITLFNEAHALIGRVVKLYPDDAVDVSLTAGTQKYTYDADVLRVWHAAYFSAAGTSHPLTETSVDEKDYNEEGWRQASSGIPHEWFEEGSQIGFYPAPNTTTSASYPKVVLYCQQRRVLTTSDSLPDFINDPDAWVDLMAYKWARRRHPADTQMRAILARKSLNALSMQVMGRAVRSKPSMHFDIPLINH